MHQDKCLIYLQHALRFRQRLKNVPSTPGVLPQHADVLAGVGGGGRLQKQSLSVFAEPRAAERDDITNEWT